MLKPSGSSATFIGWSECNSASRCGVGYGDCDDDNGCLPGLKCTHNWLRQQSDRRPDLGFKITNTDWGIDYCHDPNYTDS